MEKRKCFSIYFMRTLTLIIKHKKDITKKEN